MNTNSALIVIILLFFNTSSLFSQKSKLVFQIGFTEGITSDGQTGYLDAPNPYYTFNNPKIYDFRRSKPFGGYKSPLSYLHPQFLVLYQREMSAKRYLQFGIAFNTGVTASAEMFYMQYALDQTTNKYIPVGRGGSAVQGGVTPLKIYNKYLKYFDKEKFKSFYYTVGLSLIYIPHSKTASTPEDLGGLGYINFDGSYTTIEFTRLFERKNRFGATLLAGLGYTFKNGKGKELFSIEGSYELGLKKISSVRMTSTINTVNGSFYDFTISRGSMLNFSFMKSIRIGKRKKHAE